MACTVSVGRDEGSVWIAKNKLYGAFVEHIQSLPIKDDEAIKQIVLSFYHNGISLDLLEKSNLELALRVAKV